MDFAASISLHEHMAQKFAVTYSPVSTMRILLRVLPAAVLLGACSHAPEQPSPAPTTARETASPWVWTGKMPYFNQERFLNVSSIHRDGKYIRYLIGLEEKNPDGSDRRSTREIVADCEGKVRVELLGAEAFSPSQLKSYYPGTIIGAETQFACDEATRRGLK
jgi:hypothetical protein